MTDVDYTPALTRLEALITEDLHTLVDPETVEAGAVGWGLLFNILHQVEAITTLHRHLPPDASCYATAPLRRALIEYAVTLVWLADERNEAIHVLDIGLKNDQQKLAQGLDANGLRANFPDEALQVIKSVLAAELPKHPDETLRSFENLLTAYSYENLRVYWRVESRFSHPSLSAAQIFYQRSATDWKLSQRPQTSGELVPCIALCVIVLLDSMAAYNTLLVGRPWTVELNSIAADLGREIELPKRKK